MQNRRAARLDIRVGEADKALFSEAAALAHMSVSSFVVGAARERAESLLAERRRIVLDAESYDAFVAALDAAPTDNPALRALFAEPSPFESR